MNMVKSNLNELLIGDFFTAPNPNGSDPLLYQKIEPINHINAILLNTGQLCNVYDGYPFQKVTVTFNINPTE
jgi:hypothetical protein